MSDDYHTDIIRSKLTRNIATTFNEVREELIMAVDDFIPTHEDSMWQSPNLKAAVHRERRVGQGSHSRQPSACDLPCYKSYICWSSSMFVISGSTIASAACVDLFNIQAGTMTIRL
jgi:hypothetical protein